MICSGLTAHLIRVQTTFRLCSQHFTVKLWLPQMLPNFGYGCQIMPTDVKKQGLPQMSANRPNIGSTRNIVMFWPWNTRGVPVNAPRNPLKEIQQCRTVWSSSPRQEPTNTTTWEYKIGHRKSGTIEDHVTTWSNGSSTVRLGQGIYHYLSTSTPDRRTCSQDVTSEKYFPKANVLPCPDTSPHACQYIKRQHMYNCNTDIL